MREVRDRVAHRTEEAQEVHRPRHGLGLCGLGKHELGRPADLGLVQLQQRLPSRRRCAIQD